MKKISLGCKVLVQFEDSDPEVFEIVDPSNADVSKGKISADSRFAQAVLGTTEGAEISYKNLSSRVIKCKIIKLVL